MSHLALAGIDPEANEYDDAKDSILGEGKHEKETANIFFPCWAQNTFFILAHLNIFMQQID